MRTRQQGGIVKIVCRFADIYDLLKYLEFPSVRLSVNWKTAYGTTHLILRGSSFVVRGVHGLKRGHELIVVDARLLVERQALHELADLARRERRVRPRLRQGRG